MKKVLLTGASHGLGRSALDFLIEHNIEVVAIARHIEHLQHLKSATVHIHAVDLTQMYAHQAEALLQGCDTVWHCAALSSPWGAYDDFYAINVQAVETLLQAAGRLKISRLIHISTPSLYFDFSHRRGVCETQLAQQWANHYVSTKYLAEQAVLKAVAAFPYTQYLMLRPRAIFGEYDRVLIPRLLQLHQQGKGVLKLPRGGDTLMDLTYVGNVIEAMRLASISPHIASGSVFNITNQEPWSLQQVLQELFQALGKDMRIQKVPYVLAKQVATLAQAWANISGKEPVFTPYSIGALSFDMVLDNTQAQNVLAYRPVSNMHDAIVKTAQAFKAD
ncbi:MULTISPECIES: NAD-dependent epimerase/dehydratase family protein [Vitreoscilla]|uniref:NAD-dependent epimerase/dehydratase family protein n=1 Tax=Vitreoscilla stercoraria TaxID=61 RepID=A0ABY4E7S1_VITST|nr:MULTISPECIES: NAD-dependent epimerase/dehydratase family protein [Vitreoscilla]AUZ04901.1 hypothetical protein ADP71_12650 [Vitreoscilla sp. C1]UOO91445.1 NAD-dependent epimerase/dehydratase family protein [Vitreoscilla stercoraria]